MFGPFLCVNPALILDSRMGIVVDVVKIACRQQSVNPQSGVTRWRINAKDTALLVSQEWFDVSRVRGSRGVRKDGTLRFTTGVGYAIIDADLLGGSGDGRAERVANDAGFYFRAV